MSARPRLVTFRRGASIYGVDVDRVRKVLRVPAPRPIAAAPEFVTGGVTVEGRLEVLVDLAAFFEDTDAEPPADRAVLVSVGGRDFGLAADRVGQVADVEPDGLLPLPPFLGGARRDALRGVAPVGREQVLVVDLTRLLEHSGLETAAGAPPSAAADEGPDR